jgi:hypothetical protein
MDKCCAQRLTLYRSVQAVLAASGMKDACESQTYPVGQALLPVATDETGKSARPTGKSRPADRILAQRMNLLRSSSSVIFASRSLT